MARNWDSLSSSTQHRYSRAGVSRSYYESGGSLKAARGHASTPERPEQAARHPERFESYVSLREDIRSLKRQLYGSKYNEGHKERGGRAHLQKVREILRLKLSYDGSWDEFWDDYPDYDRDDYGDVEYYH
jgi:hypothetical protein